jgi:hypothetical protein
MSVVQRKRQLTRMNGVQKKSYAIFFVNTNNKRKVIYHGDVEPKCPYS